MWLAMGQFLASEIVTLALLVLFKSTDPSLGFLKYQVILWTFNTCYKIA